MSNKSVSFVRTDPIAPRVPPTGVSAGPLAWLKANLFSTPLNTLLTVFVLWILWSIVPGAFAWLGPDAVFQADDSSVCRQADGACYPFLYEKYRLILFGLYPFDQQWRPLIVICMMIALLAASANRNWWRNRYLWGSWAVSVPVMAGLMFGGFAGLEYVPTSRWGGLALTIGLSTVALVFAFPLSLMLALGRRSNLPAIKVICICYIELIRGVPLITVLFMSSVLIPLFLPQGVSFDNLLRAQIGITMFLAAYLAEAIRGGLQAIPKGQYEAADSLGLTYWQKTRLIILPQALRISIPPLVNTFIGLFKDTSLVVIIGLFDLLGAARAALTDPEWLGFYKEAYLFISIIFFIFCYSMSKYSQWLEKELNVGTRR